MTTRDRLLVFGLLGALGLFALLVLACSAAWLLWPRPMIIPVKGNKLNEPCHPGCFPAGTLVLLPDGTQRIELLQVGDIVTTIGPDGRPARGVVQHVFISTNRLVAVRTGDAVVLTTDAQPFCL